MVLIFFVGRRYALAQDEASAVRLFEEMLSKDLTPDQRTLSNMILAHSWGSIEDMRRSALWRRLHTDAPPIMSVFGHSCCVPQYC